MSQHRTWDENRSPQWKYLFQKESANRRKTRKEIERERKTTHEEQEEWKEIVQDKRTLNQRSSGKIRKVSKEQLRAKQDATNNELKRLLEKNKNNDASY
tara:strand:- start:164 stop:460 length:297 start_codon:yes stop_codon:yes gene_type:complete